MTQPHPTDRDADRLNWARAATGDDRLELARASFDAGFRSYWRGHTDAGSVIVMDSPPDLEDARPWLRIRDMLLAGGVRVPQVRAQDLERGFLLLEDLGQQTFLQAFEAGHGDADALFDAAFSELLKIQALPCPDDLAPYDEAFLSRELRLFDEWFLGRHLGLSLECGDLERLDLAYRRILDNVLAQPRVFVHRDYMPRNLMPVDGGVAVIDFQGALKGPIAYDPISLFRDAFISWPEDRVDAWMARYHARAVAAGIPLPEFARFRRDADFAGLQRHIKILGLFARLNHRDGKPKYLADAPRFLRYLDIVLPRYPELAPLAEIVERYVRPALAPSTGVPA
ncbi:MULTISPECIES: phosphotransferase [unclassified Lysobacter]|uniref:aminoglycoside phosphotransferase family protein n=1 Tax=unclassified Lysobacter TaxID=2635362 RepID=UPI001BEA0BAF|nr:MULTISPECIES: phosphotransferase [unclassified Lysobacter]MBT2747365.1 phosphotransferase [Lysobacter sp. ISL-42]MBT2750876.1 phosphotransferase [Lysobacter sp. ISL-50]MBT2778337.1 phosphotransferase [Lysobacter sp. ISL-54]MBT2783999.1 phosphotransferase [Lysobacter sp. ISL-52]